MIIKKGQKYYLVEKELTQNEVNRIKAALQSSHDTMDEQVSRQVKDLQDRTKIRKDKIKDELDELNAL
jgi:hypothetical protein